MIIQIGTDADESRILWKHKESDDWQRADIDDLIDAYENRPTGELISRADAIDALGEEPEIWNDSEEEWAYRNAWVEHISAIKSLPSADRPTKHMLPDGTEIRIDEESYEIGYTEGQMADRPTGEWVDPGVDGIRRYAEGFAKCSRCHQVQFLGREMKYCPHCGCPMESER